MNRRAEALTLQQVARLDALCRQLRADVLTVLHERQTGHPGGSLSCCEILAALYELEMQVDPNDPGNPARDRFVLSKGHAAPMLYAVLAHRGFFPPSELHTLRDMESRLQAHPSCLDTPGVDATTGPLGLGLSAAVGMALAARLDGLSYRVYALLGDGELNEGTIWEACMSASKYGLDNLLAIVDWNGVQLDGVTDKIMPMGDIGARFESFGFHCIACDGHDVADLAAAFAKARAVRGKPAVLLARTVKGKGVSFMEGAHQWHGKAIGPEEYALAMRELAEVRP